MRRHVKTPLLPGLLLAGAAVTAIGCESGSERVTEPELRLNAHVQAGVPVVRLPSLSVVPGASSKLVRTKNGVNYSFSTNELEPGHAYTLWIVIYNNTAGCLEPSGVPGGPLCGPSDVVNPAAQPDMMYAAGHVAGGSGKATFSGRRTVGDMNGSINGPAGMPANGLLDPDGAEIHLLVHHHGPLLAGYMPDMIKTVDGGCKDAGIPVEGAASPWNLFNGTGASGFGRRGPNTCATIQAAVHSPL